MTNSSMLITTYIGDLLSAAQGFVISSPGKAFLSLLIYLPTLSIVWNVLRQLIMPQDSSSPPVVFHWLPVIGSAIEYGTDPLKFLCKAREKHGDVFTFILLGKKVTVALGAKGNNFVFGGKSTAFSAEDAYTHVTTPIFGKDVVYDIPNEKFMEHKKFVKFGLSAQNLRSYGGMIEDEVDHFMRHDPAFRTYQDNDINEWGVFDVLHVMQEIIILTASRTLQGREVRENMDKSFAQLYEDLDRGFTPLNYVFPNLPLPSYRRRDEAQAKMSQFYIDIIKKRRENGYNNEHDMIASLMSQKYRNGTPLKDHEIAHNMIALLMAGQHTSSATSSWIMLHLAHRPDVQEAVYQEQVMHFQGRDGKFRSVTWDDLRKLPILDSVIRETLRIHPPLHSLMRKVRSDVPVPPSLSAPSRDGTYIVRKGHYVLASPFVSQMDPLIWKEPHVWDPARWSDPEGVAAQASSLYDDENGEKVDYGFGLISKGTESPYQPFGAGKHRCIGEQFSYLQLGMVISTVIRRVELRLQDEAAFPEHNYQTMVTLPKSPRNICYRRRFFD